MLQSHHLASDSCVAGIVHHKLYWVWQHWWPWSRIWTAPSNMVIPRFKVPERLTLVTDFSWKASFDSFIVEWTENTGKQLLKRTNVLRTEDKILLWQLLTGMLSWQWEHFWHHFWWPRRGTLGLSWAFQGELLCRGCQFLFGCSTARSPSEMRPSGVSPWNAFCSSLMPALWL